MLGERFGKLIVIEKLSRKASNGCHFFKCKCDCGGLKEIVGSDLRRFKKPTRSCGCILKELNAKLNTTHGSSQSYLYTVWTRIKQRCYDKSHDRYKDYGGRGIEVHRDWKNSFENFKNHVSNLPNCPSKSKTGYSIDRLNNNKNYEPGNMKWSVPKTQMRNRRITLYLFYNEQDIPLAKFAELKGMKYLQAYRKYRSIAYTL